MRPSSTQSYRPYEFVPKDGGRDPHDTDPPSPTTGTSLSSDPIHGPTPLKRAVARKPSPDNVPGLAPMRALDYESEGEDDNIKEGPMDGDDARSDHADEDSPKSVTPPATPLRELTPSTESDADQDPEYVPLSSIRSRGIGRTKSPRSPRKASLAKPVTKAARTTRKPTKAATVSTGNKKSKLARISAGERRMSQNREWPVDDID